MPDKTRQLKSASNTRARGSDLAIGSDLYPVSPPKLLPDPVSGCIFTLDHGHWQLCTQMTGATVTYAFKEALRQTGQHPILQTDNGSCYLSHEFKTLLSKEHIEHHLIHPCCPNENAEVERANRTIKEDLYPEDAESFEQLNRIVKERIHYYNHQRYHSGIGFITPYVKYRGNPSEIFEQRKQKIQNAKEQRIKTNWIHLKEQEESRTKHEFKPNIYSEPLNKKNNECLNFV